MAPPSPEHYTGVTDVNGRTDVKTRQRYGVETPIRSIVMPDDEGGNVELPFSVIFNRNHQPGRGSRQHVGPYARRGGRATCNKRPLLAVEASHKDGQFDENNEQWATHFNPWRRPPRSAAPGRVPDQSSLAYAGQRASERTDGKRTRLADRRLFHRGRRQ